jgi:hypothetical protein
VTPEQDLALEADLLADQKECAEHVMLVDLGRNDVGKVGGRGKQGGGCSGWLGVGRWRWVLNSDVYTIGYEIMLRGGSE